MTDVVEQGKSMLSTIEYTKANGITQAYPDFSVAKVLGKLVAEVERLRATIERVRALALNPVQIVDGSRRVGPCVVPHEILDALEASR